MKRLHLHVAVNDLERGIEFYEALFGAAPTSRKPDYAKWRLDDPHVNFAISARGAPAGVDHVGIEVDSSEELAEVSGRMEKAGEVFDRGATACCYAESEKAWVRDPQGVAWEAFHTTGETTSYGREAQVTDARIASAGAPSPAAGGTPLPSVQPDQACCDGPGESCD